MAIQREDNLNEMKEWLVRLERYIEANKFLKHQDTNIEIEYFFRDLLNFTFGWNLDNKNAMFGASQDSFDLSDNGEGLAVQVTVTQGAKKIRKTIKSFVGTHDSSYKRLAFVYPFVSISKSKADFSGDLKGYDFDAERDRISLGKILGKAQDMEVAKQSALLQLLRDELQPLGSALKMGVDQTLETLISVIKYMSDHAPTDAIDMGELKPDQERKLKRFKDHSDYLLSQYSMHQGLHVSVEQARDAIGYDTVRAAKIQAWLRSNSLEFLGAEDGNAQRAFRGMVDKLITAAHVSGNNTEETAVRFLLADEFIRCNVFPNPKV